MAFFPVRRCGAVNFFVDSLKAKAKAKVGIETWYSRFMTSFKANPAKPLFYLTANLSRSLERILIWCYIIRP